MNREKEREKVNRRLDELEDNHCKNGCNYKSSQTNPYCLKECEVGKEIQSLGIKLLQITNQSRKAKRQPLKQKKVNYVIKGAGKVEEPKELTVEVYLELKKQNKIDDDIGEIFNMDKNAMHRFKKKHGLLGTRKGSAAPKNNTESKAISKESHEIVKERYKKLLAERDKKIETLEKQIQDKPTTDDKDYNLELDKLLQANVEKDKQIQELQNKLDMIIPKYQELEREHEGYLSSKNSIQEIRNERDQLSQMVKSLTYKNVDLESNVESLTKHKEAYLNQYTQEKRVNKELRELNDKYRAELNVYIDRTNDNKRISDYHRKKIEALELEVRRLEMNSELADQYLAVKIQECLQLRES